MNIDKIVQMRKNVSDQICNNNLFNEQPMAIADDFKYLGFNIDSTNKDIEVRIGLTWSAFAKLKPILTSPKPTVKFKMCLFKVACTSILHYGCKARVLAQALTAKLGKFARKCYRIMLGICQVETQMTTTDLYHMADEHPISEMIRKHQLQFTRHCLCMIKDEPACIRARSGGPITACFASIKQDRCACCFRCTS